ncbi:SIR2 family NAD-dependent protein deacylase [Haliangium ochraceum]|uniref:protein acetyllysine N-acetyltransferase n=1 Tax=Haliangium ochraceum (strain DSM 14365 / JCM 11303 / SMP-2) TaxID=502025 RepID=D0LVG3_HALO1|nr:Sir2 family NAD-dependent protein deacetylase [Haliangium ochraceum]ACY17524.1 Silent information regulator protein Sir2 [Haliangium ochraceum DSM 14365]
MDTPDGFAGFGGFDLERARARLREGPCLVLTGAGISAESGIPTFRGKDGYWTVGSTVYHPQELATNAAFERLPDEVWQWYLYRRSVCRRAQPNPAHDALVTLEQHLGDAFLLITQNVDGLHPRAGQSRARTYSVHGDIDLMRCAAGCSAELLPVPDQAWPVSGQAWPVSGQVGEIDAGQPLDEAQRQLLRCPRCGGRTRPHVLWFDEYYDEAYFRFHSSRDAATRAALLLIVGTSASTNLPWQVVTLAQQHGATIIDINLESNPFEPAALASPGGAVIRQPATAVLPPLVAALCA